MTDDLAQAIEEIIETADATQGPAYADMLTMALHLSQLARCFGMLVALSQEAGVPKDDVAGIREASLVLTYTALEQHARTLNFKGSWKEMLAHVKIIMARIEQEEKK
jgi:hypothetical protein